MKLELPGEGTIDIYMKVLRAICGDTSGKSMIDLMCCTAPNTPKLGFYPRRYVDVIDRKLDDPHEQRWFLRFDVLKLFDQGAGYKNNNIIKYDVAICSDGIEHLYPDDGRKLIDVMQGLAEKQIIFTPLGEIFPLHNTWPDDPEAHHSLWTPDDFPGWASIVFPEYHRQWGGGAFFSYHCQGIENDFERVKNLL
jgi:hypothetical protein